MVEGDAPEVGQIGASDVNRSSITISEAIAWNGEATATIRSVN